MDYIPGVCNIGPQEIARRRNIGWIGLIISILLLGLLIATGVNAWWRLFVFFPATLSASGFLQAHFHFCSGFARKGIFNFGPAGKAEQVGEEASKAEDKKTGNKITLYAVLIGVVITILVVLI